MSQTNNPHPASAVFYDRVAQYILDQHAHEIPDLRQCTVLLPNYHVAQPLTKALSRVSKHNSLLLPNMITLADWAQSFPLEEPLVPDTCRTSVLYQALREHKWFAEANLWGIAAELVTLLDELTRHHVTLPMDESDFIAQLEQAYQAKSNETMQFEARVVHELWYAMTSSGELDTARAYQLQLAQIALNADTPLVVLLTSTPGKQEALFLEAYAEQAPVKIFDLRDMIAEEASCAALLTLPSKTNGSGTVISLRDQADVLREQYPEANLSHRMQFFGANSLEQEARAAEIQVLNWLREGKKDIALVANDRLVARRVRALLERSGVQVHDESGWLFSTSSVSTVIMRWLDTLQNDFYYQDMIDLLKSPFIFADQSSIESKHAVYNLEKLVRKHGVTSNIDAYLDLAHADKEVQKVLARLRQASCSLKNSTDTLSGWLNSLDESMDILGVLPSMKADAAGAQLLDSLKNWQEELAQDKTQLSRTAWRRWLTQQLDAHSFNISTIDSTVVLTHLAATRWRSFDAVLLLGSDAAHLPSIDGNGSVWFNDAVRGTLELPTREDNMAVQRDNLLALLSMNDTVLATWQSSKKGEINMISPYLEMLRAIHELAYGNNLADTQINLQLKTAILSGTGFKLPQPTSMPAPTVPVELVPKRISPSGYNSLVACPYQYFARHMLRLNEMDEVKEGIEKRDYGQWVHDALHRFHELFPVLVQHPRAALEDMLNQISSEVFAKTVKRDYLARAWLSRWQQSIPSYLDAQLKSEAEGWRYKGGELPFEMPLGDDLTLHGRIDRIDHHTDGRLRVMDYKVIEAGRLRSKLKEAGEDVQLPCYASVYEADEAAFISIDKDKIVTVSPTQDIVELEEANTVRLLTVFDQMKKGAALPANGVGDACAYCETRGVCRKTEW